MTDDGRAFWDRTAHRYDRSMWLLGGPMKPMLRLLSEEVAGLEQVLEVAAGTGLVTRVIAPVVGRLVASDYAEAMVRRLADRAQEEGLDNVEVRQLDVLALDGTESYDAVVAANVLHLLPDLDGALSALLSVLRPGGRLVVPTYCHRQNLLSRATSAAMSAFGFPGQRQLDLDRLQQLMTERGLVVRRAVLLPGLLPIGFVSAELPAAQP